MVRERHPCGHPLLSSFSSCTYLHHPLPSLLVHQQDDQYDSVGGLKAFESRFLNHEEGNLWWIKYWYEQ